MLTHLTVFYMHNWSLLLVFVISQHSFIFTELYIVNHSRSINVTTNSDDCDVSFPVINAVVVVLFSRIFCIAFFSPSDDRSTVGFGQGLRSTRGNHHRYGAAPQARVHCHSRISTASRRQDINDQTEQQFEQQRGFQEGIEKFARRHLIIWRFGENN
jgi:hypothetical protein